MSDTHSCEFQEIFDRDGNSLGAVLGPEAWSLVRDIVLKRYAPQGPVLRPEPIDDWRELQRYWDFQYPVDHDVACPLCGNSTEDWEHDDPRKFRLTAANFGGLVAFQCMKCHAKVLKRHFKDTITVEARAFQPEKSSRELGRSDD